METRRHFLKAGTAAMALVSLFRPTVLLRPEITREALLMRFCDADAIRYDLSTPFQQGSLTYATTGREIVRCELSSVIDDANPVKRPPAEELYKTLWIPDLNLKPFELPKIETLEESDFGQCPVCHDRRLPYLESDADYPSDYDPDDNTIRDRSCHWCHDPKTKRLRDKVKTIMRVDGFDFQFGRLAAIADIPNVRARAIKRNRTDKHGLLQFAGDGFQGISMSLASDWRTKR
jgi:hypothetical protein